MRSVTLLVATVLLTATPGALGFAAAFFHVQDEGDRGDDVALIQRLLMHHGYGDVDNFLFGPISTLLFGSFRADGDFDADTRDRVEQFQADNALAADGIVGHNTWSALVVTLRAGDEGDAVTALQHALNAKRDAGLTVTGDFDAATDQAVRAFQAHAGISVDGIVGPVTWRNLVWHYQTPDVTDDLCGYRRDAARWGTASTVAWMQAAAADVAGLHGRVALGDISLEHGGDIAGHASHEDGLDVDIRPMRTDRDQCARGCQWSWSCYDQAATRDLIEAINDAAPGHVKVIWFNDPDFIDEGLTRPLGNHDDHLHVRFCERVHHDGRYDC